MIIDIVKIAILNLFIQLVITNILIYLISKNFTWLLELSNYICSCWNCYSSNWNEDVWNNL